ncbi:S24 family peptidase [Variovorax sp. 160MFSha2.1]|uniref:S24 family peptidase n=1 Tax=Variovorax sp. 160MFSha2.1 TaxID=3158367 RepID=UPI003AB072EA
MPAKPDPLSAQRREAFREYCRRKGWQNENGTWATTAIGSAIKKPTNKVSDLLNGKGSFGAAIARDIEAAVGDLSPGELDGLTQNSQFVEVYRADVSFSNGTGKVVYHEDDKPPLSFRSDFLRKLGVSLGNAVVVDADGISNDPTIREGAVVLLNRGDTSRLDGGFFAFRVDGELMIKRLERIEGVGVLATADNPNFKPKQRIYRDDEDFEVIGRAVWTGIEL